MKTEHRRRVERLEAQQDERPEMVVLVCQDGQTEATIAHYRAATPGDGQAELVVCVRRFS